MARKKSEAVVEETAVVQQEGTSEVVETTNSVEEKVETPDVVEITESKADEVTSDEVANSADSVKEERYSNKIGMRSSSMNIVKFDDSEAKSFRLSKDDNFMSICMFKRLTLSFKIGRNYTKFDFDGAINAIVSEIKSLIRITKLKDVSFRKFELPRHLEEDYTYNIGEVVLPYTPKTLGVVYQIQKILGKYGNEADVKFRYRTNSVAHIHINDLAAEKSGDFFRGFVAVSHNKYVEGRDPYIVGATFINKDIGFNEADIKSLNQGGVVTTDENEKKAINGLNKINIIGAYKDGYNYVIPFYGRIAIIYYEANSVEDNKFVFNRYITCCGVKEKYKKTISGGKTTIEQSKYICDKLADVKNVKHVTEVFYDNDNNFIPSKLIDAPSDDNTAISMFLNDVNTIDTAVFDQIDIVSADEVSE